MALYIALRYNKQLFIYDVSHHDILGMRTQGEAGDDRRLFAVERMPTRWLMPTLDGVVDGAIAASFFAWLYNIFAGERHTPGLTQN